MARRRGAQPCVLYADEALSQHLSALRRGPESYREFCISYPLAASVVMTLAEARIMA